MKTKEQLQKLKKKYIKALGECILDIKSLTGIAQFSAFCEAQRKREKLLTRIELLDEILEGNE